MNRKILVIGPLNEGALAESYARAFERLGMEVVRFDSERAANASQPLRGQSHSAPCLEVVPVECGQIARPWK